MPQLPNSARPYRVGMWILLGLSIPFLALAAAAVRGLATPAMGILALIAFFVCLLLALLFGLWARRAAIEERASKAAGSMLVLLAGKLNKQDDATLERIVQTGGPAAEAAALLLLNRRSGK